MTSVNLWRSVASASLFLVVALAVTPASAGPIQYLSGQFVTDDDLVQLTLTVQDTSAVTARTLSFAGGVNFLGAVIPAGGFAPILSLFGPGADLPLIAIDRNGGPGGCGTRANDPKTGFCWDGLIQTVLSRGTYRLVLSQDDNAPLGPTFFDGFLRAGGGNFTGPEFRGGPGSFLLVNGDQRTANWAVEISGADQAQLVGEPSPASLCLIALGLIGAGGMRRRSCSH